MPLSITPPYADERIERILFTRAEIEERVRALAAEIAADYRGCERLRLVGVLKGAFVFLADLAREIRAAGGPTVAVDFIRASAYGHGIKGAGEVARPVRLEMLPDDLAGCQVLLVEDILDQGFTLCGVVRALEQRAAVASLGLCVLLLKQLDEPSPEVEACRRQLLEGRRLYTGFAVPDRWVAGYGLDVGEEYRDLPEVVVVREACFRN